MKLTEARIGVLGAGAMGRALAKGLCAAGVDPDRIGLCDKDRERAAVVAAELGATALDDPAALAAGSDAVLLAVKPGDVGDALASAGTAKPLWISIAAGVPLATLRDSLPGGARVVRAMPNTPALVGEGATAFAAAPEATAADRALASAIFGSVGEVWEAPSEDLLDPVTGLSGSGPAYVFVFLEALADAGVREGLPRAAAQLLATQTVLGAAKLALETGGSPAQLKDQVTSPGGTTIAGLGALEASGLRSAIYEAVRAATRRSRELAG